MTKVYIYISHVDLINFTINPSTVPVLDIIVIE